MNGARMSFAVPRRRAIRVGLSFIWQGVLAFLTGDQSVSVDFGVETDR